MIDFSKEWSSLIGILGVVVGWVLNQLYTWFGVRRGRRRAIALKKEKESPQKQYPPTSADPGKRQIPPSEPFSIGHPNEWAYFQTRYELFLNCVPRLVEAQQTAFRRTVNTGEPVDRVVFFLGRLIAEDFWEIFLLCGNGYGIAAQKVLRGMYERVVTARFLHLNPDQSDSFMDFYWVSLQKTVAAIRRTFGEDLLPVATVKEIDENCQRVRDRFLITDCKKCGTKRVNYTWSKVDFVSMARIAGSVGELIVPGYYLPMEHTHSTAGSILTRLEMPAGGGIGFDPGPQRIQANMALSTAHSLMLNVLELQKDHFKLTFLEEPLQACFKDFLEVWQHEKAEEKPTPPEM